MKWFRMYSEMIRDQKIIGMADSTFRIWIYLLCLANKQVTGGVRGEYASSNLPITLAVKRAVNMHHHKVGKALKELEQWGMISIDNNKIRITNWEKYQYKSDYSTERVKRYRQRLHETTPDTDTEYIRKTNTDLLSSEGKRICSKCKKPFKPLYEDHKLCLDCFKTSQSRYSGYVNCIKCTKSGSPSMMQLNSNGLCKYCQWEMEETKG